MSIKIIRNLGYCKECDVEIESTHRHEMTWCPGGHVAVDGGRDYLRRAGNWNDFEDRAITEDVKEEPIELKLEEKTYCEVADKAHEAARTVKFASRFIGSIHRTESDAVMFLAAMSDDEFERAVRTGKAEMLNRFFGLPRQRLTRRVRLYKRDLIDACDDPF